MVRHNESHGMETSGITRRERRILTVDMCKDHLGVSESGQKTDHLEDIIVEGRYPSHNYR